MKKQENQVVLSLLNQGEWTLLETYKKICNRPHVLPDEHETTRINCYRRNKSSHSSPNLSISVVFYTPLLKFLTKCLILLVMFFRIQRLIQCLGSKGHLAKSKSHPNQLHHIKLNKNGSFACHTNCTKFKSYRICRHTIAVAEKEKYLEKLLRFV